MDLEIRTTIDGTYSIVWYDEDTQLDGDVALGDWIPSNDPEHAFVSKVVKKSCPPDHLASPVFGCGTLVWFRRKDALKALQEARRARKQWQEGKGAGRLPYSRAVSA